MRLVRLLLYVVAAFAGLYLMAAVLYVIPMLSGRDGGHQALSVPRVRHGISLQ